MNEYCIVFFMLIEESLQIDGTEYLIQSQISALPHMKRQDARKVVNSFTTLSSPRKKERSIDQDRKLLKKLLMGKK